MTAKPLGSIRVDFVADIASFIKNVKVADTAVGRLGQDVKNAVNNMGKAFKGVGAAVFSLPTAIAAVGAALGSAKLASTFDAAAQSVDKMNDASKRIGIGVEQLSALSFAAGDAGLEFETLSKLLGKAQKNLAASAFGGGGPAQEAIENLQLGLLGANNQLRGMDELLPEIAVGIQAVGSHGEKLRLAEQIFGREGGGAFVQWLEDSGDLVQTLAQKIQLAHKYHVVFTKETAERMSAYRDSIDHVAAAWLGLRIQVMDKVAPFLTRAAEDLALWISRVATVAGNVTQKIVDSFGDGPAAADAREQIKQFGIDLANILGVALQSGGELAVAGMYDTLAAGWRLIGEDLVGWAQRTAIRVSALFNPAMFMQYDAIANMMAERDGKFFERLDAEGRYEALPQAWTRAVTNMDTAVEHFAGTIARMNLGVGFEEAAKAAREFIGSINPPDDARSEWKNFFDGLRIGFKELQDEASDFGRLGRDLVTTFGRDLSSGLSQALIQGRSNFEDFGDRVVDVLTNIGEKLADMIVEMMLLRALTGIGGAIGDSFTGGGGGLVQVSGTAGAAGSGGYVPGAGLPGRASGGRVTPGNSYVVGERGWEIFEPDSAGTIIPHVDSSRMAVGGTTVVQIIDQRSSGQRPQVTQQQGPKGEKVIRVLIQDVVAEGIRGGQFDRAAGEAWGVGRRATSR